MEGHSVSQKAGRLEGRTEDLRVDRSGGRSVGRMGDSLAGCSEAKRVEEEVA
jgi:hypothetical protein